jgi:hypothetical protein
MIVIVKIKIFTSYEFLHHTNTSRGREILRQGEAEEWFLFKFKVVVDNSCSCWLVGCLTGTKFLSLL